ncbi:uncharacterized protein LOC107041956 [Diachasma alloeum]|uniref:uncharacterized protein LOC107041956 n=1 Tax=Diachasma alloeum TaxID=454923 RepID=UPI0007381C49|nr:uncharacterized protein LOC107041956 [Diachasma alloeum]
MVSFAEDLKGLSDSKEVGRRSPLLRLVPFLDGEGLIRLTGRLHKSAVNEDFKHPVVLPASSRFMELMLFQVHQDIFHGGVQLMQATLWRKYWIIGGRRPVKGFILRCVTCARFRGAVAKQLMGQLPLRRITPARSFLHCGVDSAGPVTLLTWRGHGAKTYKGFMVVFVCFTTSAVHLELATEYSTEGFRACYKRFTARRGNWRRSPVTKGRTWWELIESSGIFSATLVRRVRASLSVAKDGTNWIFNPPGAPYHGGKWEAAVKSAKFHLKRVIGEAKLTYEKFTTLLTQIEVILNSRPLWGLPDEPDEFAVLTPGHFIIGSAISIMPEPSLAHLSMAKLSRYQLVRRMVEKFWEQ